MGIQVTVREKMVHFLPLFRQEDNSLWELEPTLAISCETSLNVNAAIRIETDRTALSTAPSGKRPLRRSRLIEGSTT